MGPRRTQVEQNQSIITFHPEITAFLPSSPPCFFLPPFRSCPCLCVLGAKSHIPSLPLPAQTPFGGPTFPAAVLGITCNTHICKTNQVWKGQGVPARLRKAAASIAAESLPEAPEVGVSWRPTASHGAPAASH